MNQNLLRRFGASVAGMLTGCLAAFSAIPSAPVTQGATEGAQKVYKFLVDNYGKNTISGVMNDNVVLDGNVGINKIGDLADVKAVMAADGGKIPAILGFDLMHSTGMGSDGVWYKAYTQAGIDCAIDLYKQGGIPAFCYHWKDPSGTAESNEPKNVNPNFDFTKGFKAGTHQWDEASSEYKALVRDIDVISKYFKQLQDVGVAAIWRPLHEASGGWFWWGAKSADDYVALYRLVYDRMVNTNGLKNLIWVWNIERTPTLGYDFNALDKAWYPGDEYVDIIGVDYYANANDNGSLKDFYNKIKTEMGDNRIITLSENGPIPDVGNMHTDGAIWSWWMTWCTQETNYIAQTSGSVWTKNMADDRVITLDEMKDWGTYIAPADPCDAQPALKREVECGNFKATAMSGDEYSGGKGLSLNNDDDFIDLEFDVPSDGYYKVLVQFMGAAFGAKTFSVVVNGVSANVNGGTDNEELNAGSFKLKKGANTVSVKPAWTWVPVDYVRLEVDADAQAQAESPCVLAKNIADENATGCARRLYNFLASKFGKNIVAGFMTGDLDGESGTMAGNKDVDSFKVRTGKMPALVGVDMMNSTGKSAPQSWYKDYTKTAMAIAKDTWKNGGIPAITWHWRNPDKTTDGFYVANQDDPNNLTSFDFTSAMNADGTWNTSSDSYKNMVADIDVVADYFLELQADSVAAIWRPLHEASGAWFWWGTQGGANYAKLYQLVYNEMVNVKGVHNLVWVWNPEYATDADWNPGAELYDVVSVDIYNKDFDYQSNSPVFIKLKDLSNKGKLIALSENGPMPDPSACFDDNAVWSWVMPWYQSWNGKFLNQTADDQWVKIAADDRVIFLDDMPGWEKVSSEAASVAADASASVYPSRVQNYFIVDADAAQVTVSGINGRTLLCKQVNGRTVINSSAWAPGVYVVTVDGAQGRKAYKLVK